MSSAKIVYQPSETTHWKNLYPSKMMLLGSQNFLDNEDLVAKIAHVEINQIKNSHGKDENVVLCHFNPVPEYVAPMTLNITNAKTIAGLYGESYDGWKGKSIQIYKTLVKGFATKEMVSGLRVRNTIPATMEDSQVYAATLVNCATLGELQKAFIALPKHLKPNLKAIKDELKQKLKAANV